MAKVKVRIPTPLRKLTAEKAEVELEATDLRSAVEALNAAHDGIKARLCDDEGSLRRFVNVYVNDEDARFLKGLDTELQDGDDISIVPAIAGGC